MMYNLLTLITQSCQKLGRKLQKGLRRINPRKDRPRPIDEVWFDVHNFDWSGEPIHWMECICIWLFFFDVIRVLMNCVGRERFAKQEKRDERASILFPQGRQSWKRWERYIDAQPTTRSPCSCPQSNRSSPPYVWAMLDSGQQSNPQRRPIHF